MDSAQQMRAYRLRMGPRYVSKYSEGGSDASVEEKEKNDTPNDDTTKVAPTLRAYASKLKTTRKGYFNDVEKGDHGSDTSSGSGDSDQEDSTDSDDKDKLAKKEKNSPNPETPNSEPKREPTPIPSPPELISAPRFEGTTIPELISVPHSASLQAPVSSVTPRVTVPPPSGRTSTAQPTETTLITSTPIVLASVELQYQRLESEVLALKEFLQESEKKRLSQEKTYLTKIQNLANVNQQLMSLTRQLANLAETNQIRQPNGMKKEKEYFEQLQKASTELFTKHQDIQHQQEINQILLKNFEVFKLNTEETLVGSQRQVQNLVWIQIILWIFFVVILVMSFLVVKTSTTRN